MKTESYEVVVIGSGAAGGAVAYMLAQAGIDTVMLEKGGTITRAMFSKDEIAYCRRDLVTPDLFDEYHVIEERYGSKWRSTPTYESGVSFWNGNIVGGSSNFMSGMFHRLHPDDFRLLSVYGPIEGANIVDWPISYEELEPYYTLAEKLVGISGKFIAHPNEPPRSTPDFPYPPTKENRIVELFDATCKKMGIAPLVTPRAILPHEAGHRGGCYYSNFCGSYGCSSGAKGSSREAFLIPALATGKLTLKSNTFVKRIVSVDAKRIGYIECIDTQTSQTFRIEANLFVVAAQAHESVRLLFNSADRFHPEGIGNHSGQLGKNLLFSGGGSGEGSFDRKSLGKEMFEAMMEPGLFVNRTILDWYVLENWWGKKRKGGSVEWMFEHQNIITRALKRRYKNGRLLWGKELGRHLVESFREEKRLRFEVFNDWLPTDECCVTIDKNRKDRYGVPVGKLRIHAHPRDVQVGEEIAKKCVGILREMGAKDIGYSVSGAPSQNLVAGGCRFGSDPKTSVLDRNCKVHGIDNLYVADAAFMPTGGSVAPTWTIYANALRVGNHIVRSIKV